MLSRFARSGSQSHSPLKNPIKIRQRRTRVNSCADVATPTLVPVEVVEVGDDDGARQRDGEDASDDAESPDQLAPNADRRDALTCVSPGTSALSPKPPQGQDTE